MQINTRNHIYLRVYERDVGETISCGTAACASVAVGILQGYLDKQVKVDLPGGYLNISWQGPGNPLHMTGPVTYVYDGSIIL